MEADERKTMSEQIPVQIIESFEASRPRAAKNKNKSSDNVIHTRSFTGLYRTLRIVGTGFLFLLFFGTVWLKWRLSALVCPQRPSKMLEDTGMQYPRPNFTNDVETN